MGVAGCGDGCAVSPFCWCCREEGNMEEEECTQCTICAPARTRKNKDKNYHIPPLFSDPASFFSFVKVNLQNNPTLSDHVDWKWYSSVTCIPPGSLFFRCVIWCVCDVFVMCYLMHIKCLFSHPLMGALGYSWGRSWETGEGEGLRCFTKSWKSKQDANLVRPGCFYPELVILRSGKLSVIFFQRITLFTFGRPYSKYFALCSL